MLSWNRTKDKTIMTHIHCANTPNKNCLFAAMFCDPGECFYLSNNKLCDWGGEFNRTMKMQLNALKLHIQNGRASGKNQDVYENMWINIVYKHNLIFCSHAFVSICENNVD